MLTATIKTNNEVELTGDALEVVKALLAMDGGTKQFIANTKKSVPKSNQDLTMLEGAALVLKDNKGKFLTVKQIWNEMKKNYGFISKGKTPWASVGSFIYIDMKEKGTNSIFSKVKNGGAFGVK